MELKQVFKMAPLALIIVGITMFAMNPRKRPIEEGATSAAKVARTQSQTGPVKVVTADGQEMEIPGNLANQSASIQGLIQSVSELDEEPIPLPDVTAQELNLIINIFQAINAVPNQASLKRADDKYIPQRIQPIIDQALAAPIYPPIAQFEAIAQLIKAAQALDLEYIVNGAIRVFVQKALAHYPIATVVMIRAILSNSINWPDSLDPILKYQYELVTNGNTPELSVDDYIAINGMPKITNNRLTLVNLGLTSLEGLGNINGVTNLQVLAIQHNFITTLPAGIFKGLTNLRIIDIGSGLTTLPAEIFNGLTNLRIVFIEGIGPTTLPAGIFNSLTNLQVLNIGYNPHLTTLPVGIFNGLTNLQELHISYNPHLTTLPAGIFNGLTNLQVLNIRDNGLTTLPAGIFNSLTSLQQLIF